MSWVCRYCSTNNDDESLQCYVCDRPRVVPINALTSEKVAELGLTGDIIVPEEFNAIGEGAFANRVDITSVVLHSDILWIEKSAFEGCQNLGEIICNTEMESIASRAFFGCTSLDRSSVPQAKNVADDAYDFSSQNASSVDGDHNSEQPESLIVKIITILVIIVIAPILFPYYFFKGFFSKS